MIGSILLCVVASSLQLAARAIQREFNVNLARDVAAFPLLTWRLQQITNLTANLATFASCMLTFENLHKLRKRRRGCQLQADWN